MNVSELARSAGLSPSGVRWYEAVGVLPVAARRQNGYREYSAHDLRLLQLVASLRRLGLPPAEAGRIARLCLERGPLDSEVPAALADHRRAIACQRQELDRLEWEIRDLEATIASTRPRSDDRGASQPSPISVLFLCNGNSGRSQMAEALLRRHGGPGFAASSAGISPRGLSAFAVRVLSENGIDWSAARSKSVEEFAGQRFDYVVTLSDSARERCPELPGPHNSLHWRIDDPADAGGADAARLEAYRQTIGELTLRLRPFIELAAQTAGIVPRNPAKERTHG
ncbi:MAG: MerR family transcriptional regulator [Dehalococcoidia bacterium]